MVRPSPSFTRASTPALTFSTTWIVEPAPPAPHVVAREVAYRQIAERREQVNANGRAPVADRGRLPARDDAPVLVPGPRDIAESRIASLGDASPAVGISVREFVLARRDQLAHPRRRRIRNVEAVGTDAATLPPDSAVPLDPRWANLPHHLSARGVPPFREVHRSSFRLPHDQSAVYRPLPVLHSRRIQA
jgi:hypothetical protein